MELKTIKDLQIYASMQEAIIANQETEIEDLKTQIRILNSKMK